MDRTLRRPASRTSRPPPSSPRASRRARASRSRWPAAWRSRAPRSAPASAMGWAASLAAMLQTVAIMGPLRVDVPLTQAISAPVLGRMEVRGHGTVAQALAAAAIRLAHNTLGTAFYIWVIVGLDAYAGTYDTIFGFLPFLPDGRDRRARRRPPSTLVVWTVDRQHRAGARLPARAAALARRSRRARARRRRRRCRRARRRARTRASTRAPCSSRPSSRSRCCSSSTDWPLLGAIAVWLGARVGVARGDRSRSSSPGSILTAALAFGTLVFGLIGGLGLEVTLQRTLRARCSSSSRRGCATRRARRGCARCSAGCSGACGGCPAMRETERGPRRARVDRRAARVGQAAARAAEGRARRARSRSPTPCSTGSPARRGRHPPAPPEPAARAPRPRRSTASSSGSSPPRPCALAARAR